jgi:hypothetical protein
MYYRVAFIEQDPWLEIIELCQSPAEFPRPVVSVAARDHARCSKSEMSGLRISAYRTSR